MDNMNLPVFEMLLDEQDGTEVNYVALVDRPAIEKNFLAFSEKAHFAVLDAEKQIVAGPVMLSDTPIYRRDEKMGEYYVMFSKDTVEKAAQLFFKRGYQNNVNLAHDASMKPDGIGFYQSFITDSKIGILPMKGFEDAPEGSWFMVAKVDNPAVWDMVKNGTFKGFSVEGLFGLKQVSMSKEDSLLEQIKEILRGIDG